MFSRRPRPPRAHDVLAYTTYGGRSRRVEGDPAAARAVARQMRAADPLIRSVRIVPA